MVRLDRGTRDQEKRVGTTEGANRTISPSDDYFDRIVDSALLWIIAGDGPAGRSAGTPVGMTGGHDSAAQKNFWAGVSSAVRAALLW
jgi:hypothetical protein